MIRIGHSTDIHQLVEGRKLILGGVEIEHTKGLLGHSDADVLCHAITEAIIGALAKGDIGAHFPDTDPKYKGADSRVLLRGAKQMMDEAGYVLADETTCTNIPGVFAVGDMRQKPLRQIVTAVADGATAVHFAEEYLRDTKA